MQIKIPREDQQAYTEGSSCRQTICFAVRRAFSLMSSHLAQVDPNRKATLTFTLAYPYRSKQAATEAVETNRKQFNRVARDARGVLNPFFRLFFNGKMPKIGTRVYVSPQTWSSYLKVDLSVEFPPNTVLLNPMLLHMVLGMVRHVFYMNYPGNSPRVVPKYHHNTCDVDRYLEHLRELQIMPGLNNANNSPICNTNGMNKIKSLLTNYTVDDVRKDKWNTVQVYDPLPWFESSRLDQLVRR